jgi:hypothetical protein
MVLWGKHSPSSDVPKLSPAEKARQQRAQGFWTDAAAQLPKPPPQPTPPPSRPSDKKDNDSIEAIDAELEFGANSRRLTLGQVVTAPPKPKRRWSRLTHAVTRRPAPLSKAKPRPVRQPVPPTPAFLSPPPAPEHRPIPGYHDYRRDDGRTIAPPTLASIHTKGSRAVSRPDGRPRQQATVASSKPSRTDSTLAPRPSRTDSLASAPTFKPDPSIASVPTFRPDPSVSSRPATASRKPRSKRLTLPAFAPPAPPASLRYDPPAPPTAPLPTPGGIMQPISIRQPQPAQLPLRQQSIRRGPTPRPAPAEPQRMPSQTMARQSAPPPPPRLAQDVPLQRLPSQTMARPSRPAEPKREGPSFGERAGAFAGALGRFGKRVADRAGAAMSSSPDEAQGKPDRRRPAPERRPPPSPVNRFMPWRRDAPSTAPLPAPASASAQQASSPPAGASPLSRFNPFRRDDSPASPHAEPSPPRRWLPASPRLDFWNRKKEPQPDLERPAWRPPRAASLEPYDDWTDDDDDEDPEDEREVLRNSRIPRGPITPTVYSHTQPGPPSFARSRPEGPSMIARSRSQPDRSVTPTRQGSVATERTRSTRTGRSVATEGTRAGTERSAPRTERTDRTGGSVW